MLAAMQTNPRATTRFIGALFLVVLITNGVGSELAESASDRTTLLVGELLELAAGAFVVGIGALTYALFRDRSPRLAASHLGFRITETAVNAMIVLSTLTAAALSGPARDALLEQRHQAQLIAIYAFACSGALWYILLHRFRVVPRFLTVSGLAGVVLLLVGSLFDLFGEGLDMLVYAAPMGLVELVVGVWLLVRPGPALAPPPERLLASATIIR